MKTSLEEQLQETSVKFRANAEQRCKVPVSSILSLCMVVGIAATVASFSQTPTPDPAVPAAQTMPVARTLTALDGRTIDVTILSKSDTAIKAARTDGKEFEIALDKLSVPDRIFLGIDPPDALDSQRFPYRIHAPLRRHGKPNVGTTTIEPGEPVEMVAQYGTTINILHAGQELEFQIPTGGETTANPPAKSRWTPAIPNMDAKTFLAAVTNDRDGPDPTIEKIYREATEPAVEARNSSIERWYQARKTRYAREDSMKVTFMSLTPQTGPTEASALIQDAQPSRAKVLPAGLREDPIAAVGCLHLDYHLKTKKKSLVPLDTYQKGIDETKAEIGWKTKFQLSLPDLARAYIKILPDPGSRFAPVSFDALDVRRLAPIFPLSLHNEVIIEEIKSDLRKQNHPVIVSTIRWEGKAANGKDFGKTHITMGLGYKSDGTIKGTSLRCLDGDGEIRDYPAEDVFAVWSIRYTFKEDISSSRKPNTVDPNNHLYFRAGDEQASIQVGINDTAQITTTSGAVAMIQFTKMDAASRTENTVSASASYRWKFRSASGQPIQSGNGELKESRTIISTDGEPAKFKSNPNHNAIIKAGGIKLAWSSSSQTQANLHYNSSIGTAKIVPSENFDKQF